MKTLQNIIKEKNLIVLQGCTKHCKYINDAIDYTTESSCCGAPIVSNTFCLDCKEHCK